MIPVSAAFKAAQALRTKNRKIHAHLVLRNVAAATEGATASSDDTFSDDFPASGAIDGKTTHLSWGAPADADDGKGRGGWKSTSAGSDVEEVTTGAVFTAGTQDGVKTVDDSVEIALQQAPLSTGTVNVLVVAGGGGGASGGGGAGGYRVDATHTVTPGAYTVTVGAGGSAGASAVDGGQGGDSTFDTITSAGGGGGGGFVDGNPGGSGSGGVASSLGVTVGGAASPAGQGNAGGGNAGHTGSPYSAGAGGGAGAVGGDATDDSHSGVGGAGLANSISGASVTYAGGGGGGIFSGGGTPGAGGAGGGGAGSNTTGVAGTANTGGGGGGGANGYTGGVGGSGIVIIAFPTNGSTGLSTASTGGTITTVGGNQIHTFRSGGTFTPAFATAAGHDDDFQTAVDATDLQGNRGWVLVGNTGTTPSIKTTTGSAYTSGKGVRLVGLGGAGTKEIYHLEDSPPTIYNLGFRLKQVAVGSAGSEFRISFVKTTGAVYRYAFVLDDTGFVKDSIAGGAAAKTNTLYAPTLGTWVRYWIWVDQTDPANAVVKIFAGISTATAKQIHAQAAVDMTDVTEIRIKLTTGGATNPDFYLDDWRFGAEMEESGTQDNVVDFGETPSGDEGTLTWTGEGGRVERQVGGAGGVYGLQNNDSTLVAIRDAAARNKVAMTFLPSNVDPLDAVEVMLKKVGSPTGNVWVEVFATSAGAPTGTAVATSQSVNVATLTTSEQVVRFTFDAQFTIGVFTYAYVLTGDYAVSGTDYLQLVTDGSAPGYASGSVYTYNSGTTTWSADTAKDAGFISLAWHGPEVEQLTHDSDIEIGPTLVSTYSAPAQQVKYARAGYVRHLQIYVKKHGAWTPPAAAKWRVRLYTADATGVPDTLLATGPQRLVSEITWSGGAGNERLYTLSLPAPVAVEAGGNGYCWQIGTSGWTPSATDHLDIRINSAGGYADGVLSRVSGTTHVIQTGKDMAFISEMETTPLIRWEAAYSDNGSTFGSFGTVTDNADAEASGSVVFTGEAKRYWKIRAELLRMPTSVSSGVPWTPVLLDFNIHLTFLRSKALTIDLGQMRQINRIEVYGYAVESGVKQRGFSRFFLETTIDGAIWTSINGYIEPACSASARNADATVTIEGDIDTEVVTDGHFVALAFPDIWCRGIRITVLLNENEYARINELLAYQVVDVTNRLKSLAESQDAEALRFRPRARAITAVFSNAKIPATVDAASAEGALSTGNTAGPYYGLLGEGNRLILWCSYFEVPNEWCKIGEFYVDDWNEQASSPDISIQARDLIKLLGTTVEAGFKTNYRHDQIVEYLANLAGISSAHVRLDRTASRVSYFAPKSVSAWEEMLTVAEAAALSRVWVDREGRIIFRAIGDTSRAAGVTTLSPAPIRFYGPIQQLSDDTIWGLATRDSAGSEALYLVQYDPDALTWSYVGAAASTKAATHGGLLMSFDDRLFCVDFDADPNNTAVAIPCQLREYDPDAATWTLRSTFGGITVGGSNWQGPGVIAWQSYLKRDSRIYASCRAGAMGNLLFEVDLSNYVMRSRDIDLGGSGGGTRIAEALVESPDTGSVYAGTGNDAVYALAGAINRAVTLFEIDLDVAYPGALATTELVDLVDGVTNIYPIVVGADGDGEGRIFASLTYRMIGGGGYYVSAAQIVEIDVEDGYAVTKRLAVSDTNGTNEYGKTGDAMAIVNGEVLTGWFDFGDGSSNPQSKMLIHRAGADRSMDLQSLHWLGTRLAQFVVIQIEDQDVIMAQVGDVAVVEWQVGRPRTLDETASITISSADPTADVRDFQNANKWSGDDRGGTSRIINVPVVTSKPLQRELDDAGADLTSTVWKADQLPWAIENGRIYSKQIDLDSMVDPVTLAANPTYGGAGAATITISSHHKRPTLTIEASGTGTITDLFLTAIKLVDTQSVVSLVADSVSIGRYHRRSRAFENNYIYDNYSGTAFCAAIATRFGDPGPCVRAVQSRLVAELELFDMVHLTEPRRLYLDDDFGVFKMAKDWRMDRMSMDFEEP
jgi:hypothetical protein